MNTTQTDLDFLAPPSQPNELGMLGAYRVISELGKGGMGYVFRAEDTRLKRTVALKVMNKKIAATPNSRTRFIEEARSMAAVHHDNVVVIFEVGERNGTPFMAMELLKGKTLEALDTKKNPLPYEKILDFATQITRGLAAAHAKGIVHRDIKPANIWVEESTERIKILDFGLALAQTPVDRLSGMGSVIGTPGYLSPEQARTDPLDDRSDLYSLGVVLYELCTGRLPLSAATVAGQLVAILAHKPKPIRELNPDIPAPLANLVHQLLLKEPRERPTSAVVLEERLKQVAVECEAKSEVALAINKLQQGLSEVVSKKQNGEVFADQVIEVVEEPVHDPLSFPSIPVTPMQIGASSSGSMKAVSMSRPVNRKTQPKPNPLKQYWPFLAFGAVVLLVIISLLAFAFSGGSDDKPTLPQVAKNNNPPAVTSQPKPAPKPEPKPPKQDNNKKKNNGSNKKKDQPKPEPKPEPKPKPEPVVESPSPTPPETKLIQEPEVAMKPETKPEPNDVPMEEVVISTAIGKGADSSARKAKSSEALGENFSIAIQTRKNIELEHGYMRFDLGQFGKSKENIREAELVLSLARDGQPVNGNIRLYGTDDPIAEKWTESGRYAITWGNSVSDKGLSGLPLLVEKTLSQADNDSEVRIGGNALAEFLRNAKTETVTLIIAGGRDNNTALHFNSKERSPEEAPKLVLKIAAK